MHHTILGAALIGVLLVPASAEDEALDQQIDSDQPIVEEEGVLSSGHVDMGARFTDDGEWTFLVHDDAARDDAEATSVWRYPDLTVFEVTDDAILTVPDDPAYEFLGAEPNTNVWVVPQTQNDDVVWLGWNTQDPEVMERIDRGITLTLTGFSGPGSMVTYLQSGTFGEPDVLWDSAAEQAQSAWVDVNTHTHANWVFTEPGVYLLELRADADLIDGSTVSDTQVFRFAVGSQTPVEDAMEAAGSSIGAKSEGPSDDESADALAGEDGGDGGDGTQMVWIAIVAAVALLAIAGIVLAVRRNAKAKRQVLG